MRESFCDINSYEAYFIEGYIPGLRDSSPRM